MTTTKLHIKMAYDKSTKNKHVYTADAVEPVTAVYIEKSALSKKPPTSITVTVDTGG